MKYFWFGDSWVAGDELQKVNDAFPTVVSQQRGAECVNLGECGSSIDEIPHHFYKWQDKISSDDVVFFCLTAPHRISLFEEGILKRISINELYPKHRPHPYGKQWFKYFDNLEQRLYNRDKVINLLYCWAKSRGIHCWFANIFTIELKSLIDVTPDDCWLIPKNDCLASSFLPVINPSHLHLSDNSDLTNEQWDLQRVALEQYIHPNYAHPNPAGHLKIAEKILSKLSKNDKISV